MLTVVLAGVELDGGEDCQVLSFAPDGDGVSVLCSFEACEVVLYIYFDWLLFLSNFLSGTPPVDKDIAFASGILIFEYTILPISVY